MKVDGNTFYHIHKINFHTDKWKVGHTIHFSKAKTSAFIRYRIADILRVVDQYKHPKNFFENNYQKMNEAHHSIHYAMKMSKAELKEVILNQMNDLLKVAIEQQDVTSAYLRYLQEITFEKVREKDFKTLPSR